MALRLDNSEMYQKNIQLRKTLPKAKEKKGIYIALLK